MNKFLFFVSTTNDESVTVLLLEEKEKENKDWK